MSDKCGVIIVAGGSGTRMGGRELKQFRLLRGLPVILWGARFFAAQNSVHEIVLVVPEHEIDRARDLFEKHGVGGRNCVVAGGERRQDSVAAGLAALSGVSSMVAVHDAARPFPPQSFDGAVQRASERSGVVFALPVTDTIKNVEGHAIRGTIDREKMWTAQTPQIFRRELLERAIDYCAKNNLTITDDAAAVEAIGSQIEVVQGSRLNIKVTTPGDWLLAEAIADVFSQMETRA